MLERHQILSCLVERRSKGKLYVVKDRITHQKRSLRKVELEVTNAGSDDGLPTSLLREISHLKALDHPGVSQILQVEVKGKVALIMYEYQDKSLKDLCKRKMDPAQVKDVMK